MEENTNQNNNEFKTFGMPIEKFSLLYGSFLIFWGLIVSLISGSSSFTSYIPSFFGIPILLFSYLSLKIHSKKKLFMHMVVLFGLIVFIGGLDLLRSVFNGNLFVNVWADLSKLMMLLTGLFFTYQCVKSFIHARKNKQ